MPHEFGDIEVDEEDLHADIQLEMIINDKFLSFNDKEEYLATLESEAEAENSESEPVESSDVTNLAEKKEKKKKTYKSKFDIPISVQNYTDVHKKDHPIWAKNLFTKEYKSFDELFVPWSKTDKSPLSSSQIYEHYVKPHAMCLHKCY